MKLFTLLAFKGCTYTRRKRAKDIKSISNNMILTESSTTKRKLKAVHNLQEEWKKNGVNVWKLSRILYIKAAQRVCQSFWNSLIMENEKSEKEGFNYKVLEKIWKTIHFTLLHNRFSFFFLLYFFLSQLLLMMFVLLLLLCCLNEILTNTNTAFNWFFPNIFFLRSFCSGFCIKFIFWK